MKSKKIMLLFLVVFFSSQLFAGEIYKGWLSNYAIKGYDPVAYFTEKKAVKGDSKFEFEWKGVRWIFNTEKNKTLFIKNPTKYLPQYDGHCAYAAGNKKVAGVDPTKWTIVKNKLYLNYNEDIQNKWLKNQLNLIKKGDVYWKEHHKDKKTK